MKRKTVRILLVAVVFNLSIVVLSGCGVGSELEQLRAERREAAQRQRRVIVNNDGGGIKHKCVKVSADELVRGWDEMTGTHVDAISYGTNAGFGMFTHHTATGEIFKTREGRFGNNMTGAFYEAGLDPLATAVEFCHDNGMELFWSFRMNDTHDADHALMLSKLKKEHPEWMLGTREQPPPYSRWSAADYGRDEIRELVYRYIEEVCQNYDIDGIFLDFFRHLGYFRRVAYGRDAGQREREMMTELLRRIRVMSERAGLERGRCILIGVRTPESVGYCEAAGFDIVRWMAEGLIDIWIPSGYFRLNKWEYSINLGHKYGVQVYPCLSETRVEGQAGRIRDSAECYRGRAMLAWSAGADGLFFFNHWEPASRLWHEVGEPEVLERLDKVYTTGARSPKAMGYWLRGGRRFLNRQVVSPERRIDLLPGRERKVSLVVGEHVERAEVTLEVRIEDSEGIRRITVELNGRRLSSCRREGGWITFAVSGGVVKKGINVVKFSLDGSAEGNVEISDLLLRVIYN